MIDTKKEQERDELHRAIWAIADELRGAVDGWDFKNYVLGTMFYRYISENLANYINEGEIKAGNDGFDYAKMSDAEAEAARKKAKDVVEQLRAMKLREAAKKVEDGIEETLTYMDFPSQHWLKIRTNNVIERMNREIRRRTRVVGTLPDGKSALMLVCARLRHVAGTQWGGKKYMNMKHLEMQEDMAG